MNSHFILIYERCDNMLYSVMRAYCKDNLHVFVDLWNEHKKCGCEMVFAFTSPFNTRSFYSIIEMYALNGFLISINDIFSTYEKENHTIYVDTDSFFIRDEITNGGD